MSKGFPPRQWFQKHWDLEGDKYELASVSFPHVPKIEYLSLAEAESMARQAKAEALEAEINYWYGEHRGYVDAGMVWEYSLCEKHIQRLTQKARELRAEEGKDE